MTFYYGMGYDNGVAITRRLRSEHPSFRRKLILSDPQLLRHWVKWNLASDDGREQDGKIRPCARNARATLWYSGVDLYSYKTVIARWIRPGVSSSDPVLLVSSTEYSKTTTRQVREATYVAGGSARILRVAYPDDIDRSMRVFEQDFGEKCEIMNDATKRTATRFEAANSALHIADQAIEVRRCLGLPAVASWIDSGFMLQRAELAQKVEIAEKMASIRREARKYLTGATYRAYVREAEKALLPMVTNVVCR